MSNFLIYLIKVCLISGILYSFYRVLFHQTTLHSLNRFLLLFIILFSVICPVLEIHSTFDNQLTNYRLWIDDFQEFSQPETGMKLNSVNTSDFTFYNAVIFIYVLGVVFFFFRFVRQIHAIIKIRRLAHTISYEKYTFIYTDNYNAPFSFFNWIFLPGIYNTFSGNDAIIEHEKVHSKNLHSLDLIVAEAFCITLWFNPFVFLLKQSLKSTHEYIADKEAIKNQNSAYEYLKILVASTELSCLSGIVNHFKCVTIKKRINMITSKKTTSTIRKMLYLAFIPIICLMIQSFSHNAAKNNPPTIRPVKGGEITLKFGYQEEHPITKKEFTHGGIDIKGKIGTPVVSTASGEVVEVSVKEGWGKLIVIKHDDTYITWYAHLNDFAVKTGDKVVKGQKIGSVGNTGQSTGPHLHYEVRKNGERVDPEEYFK